MSSVVTNSFDPTKLQLIEDSLKLKMLLMILLMVQSGVYRVEESGSKQFFCVTFKNDMTQFFSLSELDCPKDGVSFGLDGGAMRQNSGPYFNNLALFIPGYHC